MNGVLTSTPVRKYKNSRRRAAHTPQPVPEWAQFLAVLLLILQFCGQVTSANTSYTYDLNGNRTSDTLSGATDTYTYDFENRLIGLTKNIPWSLFGTSTAGPTPGAFVYTYDYRTRRIVRDESSAGGVLTNLVFSE